MDLTGQFPVLQVTRIPHCRPTIPFIWGHVYLSHFWLWQSFGQKREPYESSLWGPCKCFKTCTCIAMQNVTLLKQPLLSASI